MYERLTKRLQERFCIINNPGKQTMEICRTTWDKVKVYKGKKQPQLYQCSNCREIHQIVETWLNEEEHGEKANN